MAEATVSLRFFADTRQFVAEVRKIGDETGGAVRQVEQASQQTSSIASKAVAAVGRAYEELRSQVVAVSSAVAGALGVSSVGVGALGMGALKSAAHFEQLQARLEGLMGSAESANAALEQSLNLAGTTPFGVDEIINATSTLEAFGQGGVENLQLVTEVAAGTGQSLEETALRFGKALSGISEGFQGLRDTSGITAKSLQEYGANLSNINNVALETEKDITAAANALRAFAQAKFGGSSAKQADTLSGAFGNLSDEVLRLSAELGSVLVPMATKVLRALGNLVEVVRENIEPFKGLVVAGALLAGALSGVGAGLALAGVAFAGTIAKALLARSALLWASEALLKIPIAAKVMSTASAYLANFAETGTVAGRAIGFLSGAAAKARAALVAVTGAIGGMARASAAFLLTPMGLALAAIGTTALVATYQIRQMSREAERLGQILDETSARSTGVARGFRDMRDALENVSGVELDFGTGIVANAAAVSAALRDVSPAQAEARLSKLGITSKSLSDSLGALRPSVRTIGDQLKELTSASDQAAGAFVDTNAVSKETRAALEAVFGSKTKISAAELSAEVARLQDEFAKGTKSVQIMEALIGKLGSIPKLLTDATEEAKGLDKFLKFTGGIKDTASLGEALRVVDDRLASVRQKLDLAGISGSFFDLQKRLADPSTSNAQAEAISEYLNLMQQREGLDKRLEDNQTKAAADRVAAYELETNRRKALGDLTLDQERDRIKKQLTMVESGTQEEVRLLQDLADTDERIRKDRLDKFARSIEQQTDAINSGLADIRVDRGLSAEDEAVAIKAAITQLEAFRLANRAAFADAPERAKELAEQVRGLQRELARVEQDIPVERFEALNKEIGSSVTKNASLGVQIGQLSSAIATLKSAIASKTVEQTRADQLLASLEQQKLDLVREQTREKERQVNELAALQLQAIQREIDLLETRKRAGENVDAELEGARGKANQARLDMIDKEREASLAAIREQEEAAREAGVAEEEIAANSAEAIENIEKKAALQRQAIRDEETKRVYEAAVEQQKAREGAVKPVSAPASQERRDGSGKRSSFEPSALPGFGDGFGDSWFRRRKKADGTPKPPNFEQIMGRTNQQSGAQARYEKLKGQGFDVAAPVSQDGAAAQAQTINNNQRAEVNINVEGGRFARLDTDLNSPLGRAVVAIIESKFKDDGWRDGGQGSWA